MKKIFLFLCGFFFSVMSFGQGSILGFTIDPQSPSVTDHVKIYVGLSFTSGDCPLDQKNHTTVGLMTDANTHHCIGMLTVICNTTDTFDLGYLPAGNHKFRLVLTSGGGTPTNCTPGIIPDDIDSTLFTVALTTGMSDQSLNDQAVSIYPNPFTDHTKIIVDPLIFVTDTEIKLIDVFGRIVKTYNNLEKNEVIISRDNLYQGVYFYYVTNNESIIALGKLVVE